MTLIKKCICIFIVLFIGACSNTANKDYSVIERNDFKRPLVSDHHLRMSLLNRPVPQDQLMMLAFAQARAENQQDMQKRGYAFVDYVQIKGAPSDDETDVPSSRRTNHYISQDTNAVSILGPSQL